MSVSKKNNWKAIDKCVHTGNLWIVELCVTFFSNFSSMNLYAYNMRTKYCKYRFL